MSNSTTHCRYLSEISFFGLPVNHQVCPDPYAASDPRELVVKVYERPISTHSLVKDLGIVPSAQQTLAANDRLMATAEYVYCMEEPNMNANVNVDLPLSKQESVLTSAFNFGDMKKISKEAFASLPEDDQDRVVQFLRYQYPRGADFATFSKDLPFEEVIWAFRPPLKLTVIVDKGFADGVLRKDLPASQVIYYPATLLWVGRLFEAKKQSGTINTWFYDKVADMFYVRSTFQPTVARLVTGDTPQQRKRKAVPLGGASSLPIQVIAHSICKAHRYYPLMMSAIYRHWGYITSMTMEQLYSYVSGNIGQLTAVFAPKQPTDNRKPHKKDLKPSERKEESAHHAKVRREPTPQGAFMSMPVAPLLGRLATYVITSKLTYTKEMFPIHGVHFFGCALPKLFSSEKPISGLQLHPVAKLFTQEEEFSSVVTYEGDQAQGVLVSYLRHICSLKTYSNRIGGGETVNMWFATRTTNVVESNTEGSMSSVLKRKRDGKEESAPQTKGFLARLQAIGLNSGEDPNSGMKDE